MFRKPFFLSICVLAMATLLVAITLFRVEKKEIQDLEKLMENTSNKKSGLVYSESKREGVVKEIWARQKVPYHMRIESKESALFFFHEGKNMEVVEQMGNVICLIQEKLFAQEGKPMQEVRFIKAKKACYNYSTQLFVASDVFLAKYHLDGHTLPKTVDGIKPLSQGTAENVEFTLKSEKIDLKAAKFKATFDPKKGML